MTHYDFKLSIPKDILAEMPLVEYNGPIQVIDDIESARRAIAELSAEPIVGFDTETRPSFRKGRSYNVALVQISSPKVSCLFRVNKLGIFDELRRFMESEATVKVGLSLKDDFFMMHKTEDFSPAGFIDLQSVVSDYAIADASLQKIYGMIFGRRISKGQRLTNWEADKLTEAQCHYAAIDARACLEIYNVLRSGGFHPEESPYRVAEPKEA